MTNWALLPSITVVSVGALWGVYWAPLRQLETIIDAGPWVTFAVVATGCLCLIPFGWLGRQRLKSSNNRALLSIALGGASFVLYSNGLLYGRVAVVILLFYLTPIWSTLLVRFRLGWPVSRMRYAALVCGLAGITLVLRPDQGILPFPRSLGEWLGLLSGILWSLASTGIHVHSRTRAAETNFVFCAGATLMAAVLALLLGKFDLQYPGNAEFSALGWTLLIGAGWWAASLSAFMWATQKMEPARVGILLMSEVIVGTATAIVFAKEPFNMLTGLGAMMVITAGILETLPWRSLRLLPDRYRL